jgi:glycosyltransferase involved in cell wall biosynthesis
MSPEVSVVIPTCNRPALATRAVTSALGQTYADLEVVVVIDALAAISDPRLRVLPLPEQGKAPNARNQGARTATGRWTAFLDDDDEWLPTKLDVQLKLAATASRLSPVVATRLISRTPRSDTVMPRRLPAPGEPLSEYFTVRKGLFYGDGFIQTSTIMAPTELVRRVPFTVGLRRQQELDWALRATSQEDVELLYADEPLVLWHQDEDRERISLENPWAEQLEWLRANRPLFTPRAYSAFTMSVLSSMAAPTRSRQVFTELLREARTGRPGAIDYLTFLQIWTIPPSVRHTLRDKIVGRRTATPDENPATLHVG